MQNTSHTFVLTKMPNKRGKYNPTEIVPGLSEIYDKETGKTRICCYIPGQTTIWSDEIKNFEEVKKNIKSIVITNGVKVVSERENLLLQYMRNTGFNESNKEKNSTGTTLFKELNKEVDAKKEFLQKREKDNAIYFVNNEDVQDVRSYALAIAKNEYEYRTIEQMSEYELRLAMRNIAEKDPKKFLESMKEAFVQRKMIVIKAIYNDLVIVDKENTTLSWKDGGEFVKAPQGMNVVDYFSKSNTSAHKKAFDTIIELIKPQTSSNHKVETNKNVEAIDAIIEKALNIGIVTCTKNNMWYTYKEDKWHTRSKFVEALSENKAMLEEIKASV